MDISRSIQRTYFTPNYATLSYQMIYKSVNSIGLHLIQSIDRSNCAACMLSLAFRIDVFDVERVHENDIGLLAIANAARS